jgi:hypothetical protein
MTSSNPQQLASPCSLHLSNPLLSHPEPTYTQKLSSRFCNRSPIKTRCQSYASTLRIRPKREDESDTERESEREKERKREEQACGMPELKEKKIHRVLRLLAQQEKTQNLKESVELAIRIGDSCPDIEHYTIRSKITI